VRAKSSFESRKGIIEIQELSAKSHVVLFFMKSYVLKIFKKALDCLENGN